ncbi:MAG: ABC transporter permease [Deltaproteobacteria bacterium]|nr:ABC transporter permease [Deltaproteobacteria bacterium]
MTGKNSPHTGYDETPPHIGEFSHFWRVFLGRKVVVFGLVVILAFILTSIFAPWLAPYNPYKIDLSNQLLQPGWKHLLGTDDLGRDTLSRLIYGSRTSLMVGIIAVGIAATIGVTLGLIAGYFGSIIYTVIMRLMDAMMSIPMILLALVIASMLGGGLVNVMIALGIGIAPGYARLMCGQTLAVRENDYIMAARSIGSSNSRIMLKHILPNCLPPLIVMMTMMLGLAILSEAGLSFLGIGIEQPVAAWGYMVNSGYNFLTSNPVLSFAPGIAIILVVFAFNMVGDGLRDALDPRLRGIL